MTDEGQAVSGIDRIRFDEQGNLLDEIPCRSCGYNLKGQNPDRPCSECGTPIGRSVLGNLLRYAEPKWMDTVAKGTAIYAISMVLLILSSCLLGAWVQQAGTSASTMIAEGMSLLFTFLMMLGAWLMTTPEATEGETSSLSSRKIARAGVVAALIATFLNLVSSTVPLNQGPMIAIQAVNMVLALVSAVGTVAIFLYLRSLATRIPDAKLARRTTIVVWGFGIFYGAVVIFGALAALTAVLPAPGGGAPGGGMMIGVSFMMIAGVGVMIFGLLALLTLDRYRLALKAQAKLARETWAASLPA